MKKKAHQRKAAKPPPAPDSTEGEHSTVTHYKVVELVAVDELSLEQAINDWVAKGWRLDGIHFAMRDSSKRPAMAFILFARTRSAVSPRTLSSDDERSAGPESASFSGAAVQSISADSWKRLRQLAGVEPNGKSGPRRPG